SLDSYLEGLPRSAAAASGSDCGGVGSPAFEVPSGQRWAGLVLVFVLFAVAVVCGLAGEFAQVPAHRAQQLHGRSPAAAMACFSSAVAIRPDGATSRDGTAGVSVVGMGVVEVSARYQTRSALPITMMIRSANTVA